MKTRNVVFMVFVVAVLAAVSAPVQAVDVVLDPMTRGAIVDMPPGVRDGIPGRWVDLRDPAEGTGYLKDSAFSAPIAIQDGSMQIDYSGQPAGTQWDREIAGYFDEGAFAPDIPDLSNGWDPYVPDSTLAFSFWVHTAGASASEHLREFQIYSPNARMLFGVTPWDGAPLPDGWRHVIAPLTSFVPGGGTFDWSAVNEVKFFFSSWIAGPGGQVPPSGASVYVDDLRIIPEPATMVMLGLGGLALLKRRRA